MGLIMIISNNTFIRDKWRYKNMKSRLMNKKQYWIINKYVNKIIFKFKKFYFQYKQKQDNVKYNRAFNKIIIRNIVKQLFLCIIALSFLYLSDHLLNYFLLTKYKIIETINIDSSLISEFLTVGVSISGIFLGLYFSNMATVYSSRYANAPKNVRSLFENDFITNKSVNSIIRYIILLSGILLLNIFTMTPGYITVAIAFLYTAKIIVSFALTGRRIFGFSDVYEIASPVYYEIKKAIEACKYDSELSMDISFQAHYIKICERQLSNLDAINQFNLENKSLKSGSILDFMINNLIILEIYWKAKCSIPYDSEWFKKKEVYKKWYLAHDSEVSLAINTGIGLDTLKERDYVWFENYIFKINNDCLKQFIRDKKYNVVISYLNFLSDIAAVGVSIGETDYIINQLNEVKKIIFIISHKEDSIPNDEQCSIIDSFMLIYVSICMQIFNDFNDYSKTISEIEKISAGCDFKAINFNLVPFLNNKLIKELFNGVVSEKQTMGAHITPQWYINQRLFEKYNEFIIDQITATDRIINNYVLNWGE